ncbi:YggS family pyridoxal phosphate-dependent enzyme [Candidatus Woesearchaeota archaeon]|nr:YggS family pyridoxal phosphate-dependent enzyme [Candidatus Woesearchaeota archaeon]
MSLNKQLIDDLLSRITLVAVTKTQPIAAIKELVKLGVKNIGENKIQEFEGKYDEINNFLIENNIEDVKFHFIGHLQSNKVSKAVEMFDVIQSTDSEKIAEKVNTAASEINKKIDVMIQVNIGKEEQKHGIMPEDVQEFYEKIKSFENINIIGLMCIAPDVGAEESRKYFKQMKQLKEKLNLKELSMGMTQDYWIAIEEGATMVRLGRILYTKFDSCCG